MYLLLQLERYYFNMVLMRAHTHTHTLFDERFFFYFPFPSLGDFPDAGINPWSPALQANSLPSEPPGKPKDYT